MNYSNMIKTENTDSMREDWGEYRKALTEYILSALSDSCEKNSWVAIWGAGGCNDIELAELAKDYKLLLIDQDIEKLYCVRQELGLSPENCKCADVGFWNITDEDYEMFQALLMDGADLKEIEIFFKDLIDSMMAPISLESYAVDCSVVVGLASQLNARFAALSYLHRDKAAHINMEMLYEAINGLNKLATESLYVSVRQITKTLIVTGYEMCACYAEEEVQEAMEQMCQCFEDGIYGGKFLSGEESALIKVAGNDCWHRLMYKAVLMDKLEDVGMCQVLKWPFSNHKLYPMLMVSLSCK